MSESIAQYKIIKEIGRGARGVVYLVEHEGKRYALKTPLKNTTDELDTLVRFRRESFALSRLSHSSIVRLVEANEVDGWPFMVMDFLEAEDLKSRLENGPVAPALAVTIATQIAAALHEIHRLKMVHGDLKPDNVIFTASENVALIDFGMVSDVGQTVEDGGQTFAGTLAYASPEQAGLTAHPVDETSDLYALGILTFEMLTGKTPYDGLEDSALLTLKRSELIENVHHRDSALSPILGEIIRKLTDPIPTKRYQSARGLLADLERLGELEAAAGQNQEVLLGRNDRTLMLKEGPLAGRQDAQDKLRELWQNAKLGAGRLVEIRAPSGMGKSRLAVELMREAVKDGGIAISTRCNPIDTNGLSTILDLIKVHLSRLHDGSIAHYRQLPVPVRETLAAMAPDLASELAVESRSRASQSREAFIQQLIQIFAHMGKLKSGVVLVIEDAHWLDEFSLEFLTALARDIRSLPIAVALTVTPDEKGGLALEKLMNQAPDQAWWSVRLDPLTPTAAGQMIADLLGGVAVDEATAKLIAAPVEYVPQGIREHLEALLDADVVHVADGRAVCDEGRLSSAGISLDASALIEMRIRKLSEADLRLLRSAAALGTRIDRKQLAIVLGLPDDTVQRSLGMAELHGLISSLTETTYAFSNERLREMLLQALPAEEVTRLRQTAIQAIEAIGTKSSEHAQTLVNLYMESPPLEANAAMVGAFTQAGREAFNTYSFKSAYRILQFVYARLTKDAATETLEAIELYGMACVETERFQEAIEPFDHLAKVVTDRERHSRTLYWIMRIHLGNGNATEAWNVFMKAVRVLRKPYPTQLWWNITTAIGFFFLLLIQLYTGLGFGRLKGDDPETERERERLRLLSILIETGANIAYVQFHRFDFLHLTLRGAVYAQPLGNSKELLIARASAGGVLGALPLRPIVDKLFEGAFELSRSMGDSVLESQIWFYYLVSRFFSGRLNQYDEALPKAMPLAERYLPRWKLAMIITAIHTIMSQRNRIREVVDYQYKKMGLMDETRNINMMADFRMNYASRLDLLGRHEDAKLMKAEAMKYYEMGEAGNVISDRIKKAVRIIAFMEEGNLRDSSPLDESIAEILKQADSNYFVTGFFTLSTQIRLLQFETAIDPAEKKLRLEQFHVALKVLRRRSKTPLFNCIKYSMMAAAARIEKRFHKAERYLERAEELSDEASSDQGHYWVFTERTRLARDRKQMGRARSEARMAYILAEQMGIPARLSRLREEFPDLIPKADEAALEQRPTSSGNLDMERAMNALLQISAAASKHIDPVDQARSTLDTVVRLLGAERACIFAGDKSGSMRLFLGRTAGTEDIAEMKGFSTTVVRKVYEERKPVIITGTDQGEAIGSKSIVAHNLKSIMVVPLVLQEDIKGVIYIDSSVTKNLFTEADRDLFMAISTQIAASIRIAELAVMESERQVLKKDLELSASVQKMFLPDQQTWQSDRFRVAGFYRPAAQCGGDWWWYGMRNNRLSILLGDVTGHGAGPAMITASVASGFNILSQDKSLNVRQLIEASHSNLLSIAHTEYAMTMFGCEIEPDSRRIHFWSASAPRAILMDKECKDIRHLDINGGMLGMGEFYIEDGQTEARPGDRLFIYSDGISEMQLSDGHQLGERLLNKILIKHRGLDIEDAKYQLITELDTLRGEGEQDDDITFVMVDIE